MTISPPLLSARFRFSFSKNPSQEIPGNDSALGNRVNVLVYFAGKSRILLKKQFFSRRDQARIRRRRRRDRDRPFNDFIDEVRERRQKTWE